MAAITPTLDNNSPLSAGNHFIVTGTVVVPNTNANEFRVAPSTGSVLYCNVECTTDDATNDTRIVINQEDDFSTASQGLVAIQAEAADTFRFTAGVIL
tara:strand:- start:979 stop:1272 length:294 start_codon:yes stop_codon:yes gene_type:complete